MLDLLAMIDIKYNLKKIGCLVVFDQINSLARIYKQYNNSGDSLIKKRN